MLRAAFFALVVLSFSIPPAWGAVSSGGAWELSRSVSGAAGDIYQLGGSTRAVQSLGEAAGLTAMSGGTDVLLSGYLSSFPPAYEAISQLISVGSATFEGTALVLSPNNMVELQFGIPIDSNTILPGTISVAAVLDYLGNPLSAPRAVSVFYDTGTLSALVWPTVGSWTKGTLYELYVSTDIIDDNGFARNGISTFTFSTIRDQFVDNIAVVRSEPAIRIPIPANIFGAPYLMMLSSGTDTSAVRDANSKILTLGAERKPVKIVHAEAFDDSGRAWAPPLGQSVVMNVPYPDGNGDGLVDGTSPALRAKRLAVWRLDEYQSLWVKQLGASVDLSGQKVSYPTNHFSVYGLFGSVDTDVTDVYAYPVPFRPNGGNTARYGSWAEGIKFVNLPSEGTINFYTLSGELVRSMDVIAPQMAWNARNSDGQQVASGLYLWEIRSKNNRKTGKLVIIK